VGKRIAALMTPVVAWPLATLFGVHWCAEETMALLGALPVLGLALSWFSNRRHSHHAGCDHKEPVR